ncbi:MAG: ATP-dependent RNA helicase HrpA, partial [Planctomycetota bacterium]
TQLPKICLEAGRGIDGLIACTQPRRIAAISVADRVAEECNVPPGTGVGYQIRFESCWQSDDTGYIKFMTDGLLLSEIQGSPQLRSYDTIIIDEAHERSLNIDFLLGILKKLLVQRRDLKVIISSATMDVERFSAFFGDAPVISVEGRTYPVETRYRPGEKDDANIPVQVRKAIQEISLHDETGDILVFFATEANIRETQDLLEGGRLPRTVILPLFGRLPAGEQRKIFARRRERKIVLATNVAETSLTVPGIRYVIDTGLARVKRYNHHTQVERLGIEAVSRASADQRKGRCGRIGPGICVRLYEETDYEERPEFTDPEILRTSLASVILQMLSRRFGQVENFPFVDPPSSVMISRGYGELTELGAIDERRHLTQAGRAMARLPLEPRYARMLLAAVDHHCLTEMLIIVSALNIQDPRERPREKQGEADAAHKIHHHEESDFLAWTHLWDFYQSARREQKSNNKLRKYCKQHFLSFLRMREWQNVHRQLKEEMERSGARFNKKPAIPEDIHQALLAGLLSRMGRLTEKKDYRGSRGTTFHIFPGSGLAGKKPNWVMAAEVVETSRLFARTVAVIDPTWAEPLAGDLAKRSYTDPHWDERNGCVRAYEQVTVFGLPVVEKRRVHYGMIDPQTSRRIFIEEGLIGGKTKRRISSLIHNRRLIEEIEGLEHKARRKDLLVDEAALYEFYDTRIPESVNTIRDLERWLHKVGKDKQPLHMNRHDVEMARPNGLSETTFPSTWDLDGTALPLGYRFLPGDALDGVTLTVPVGFLPRLEAEAFEWLVPGLLPEKVALLLRSLPKAERKKCVPIPQTVERIQPALRPTLGPLLPALATVLRNELGLRVETNLCRPETLPGFLHMNIKVIDATGTTLAMGRDLNAIRSELQGQVSARFESVDREEWERKGIKRWDFGELATQVDIGTRSAPCIAFPSLQDEGDSVSLRLQEDLETAKRITQGGLRRLLALELRGVKGLRKTLKPNQNGSLYYGSIGGHESQLEFEILDAAVTTVFLHDQPDIRDEAAFIHLLESRRPELNKAAYDGAVATAQAINSAWETTSCLNQGKGKLGQMALDDLTQQLRHLVFPGFPAATPQSLLLRIPVYLQAMQVRLERLAHGPQKDRKKMDRIRPFWQAYLTKHAAQKTGERRPVNSPELAELHHCIEEFRISLFAQELGTAGPISEKRIEAALKACE